MKKLTIEVLVRGDTPLERILVETADGLRENARTLGRLGQGKSLGFWVLPFPDCAHATVGVAEATPRDIRRLPFAKEVCATLVQESLDSVSA